MNRKPNHQGRQLSMDQMTIQLVIQRDLLAKYRSILALSADSPEELRACDLERVFDAANDQRVLEGFRAWLLRQKLSDRTRSRVEGQGNIFD